jgi:hypothetical protein
MIEQEVGGKVLVDTDQWNAARNSPVRELAEL